VGQIARGLEPIPLFTDTGCRMGHYAARKQTPPPFRPPIHMDYSERDAPWRRCCCGDGEPWDCGGRAAHVGLGRSACTESPLPCTFTGMQAELACWFWHGGPGFSGLLLTPLAARPTALSRPRRTGLLLAL